MEWKQDRINPHSWKWGEWIIQGNNIIKRKGRYVPKDYLLYRSGKLWARCKTFEGCKEATTKPPQIEDHDIANLWPNWKELVESDRVTMALEDYERERSPIVPLWTGFRKPMPKNRKP